MNILRDYELESEIDNYLHKTNYFNIIEDFINVLEIVQLNSLKYPVYIKAKNLIILNRTLGISSTQNTLNVIDDLIKKDDYIDIFMLLRKIRDNLLTDFFIMIVTNENNINFEKNDSVNSSNNNGSVIYNNVINDFYKNKLKDWKPEDKRRCFQQKLFRKILIKSIPDYDNTFLNNFFNKGDNIFNDFVHNNGINYASNYLLIGNSSRRELIQTIIDLIEDFMYFFIVSIYYIDAKLLDCNALLEEDVKFNGRLELHQIVLRVLSKMKIKYNLTYNSLRKNNIYNIDF